MCGEGGCRVQHSQTPEHLDGVDDAHVGVVEIVEGTQGERGQGPYQTDTYVGNSCVSVEQSWSNIVHNNGLNTPV